MAMLLTQLLFSIDEHDWKDGRQVSRPVGMYARKRRCLSEHEAEDSSMASHSPSSINLDGHYYARKLTHRAYKPSANRGILFSAAGIPGSLASRRLKRPQGSQLKQSMDSTQTQFGDIANSINITTNELQFVEALMQDQSVNQQHNHDVFELPITPESQAYQDQWLDYLISQGGPPSLSGTVSTEEDSDLFEKIFEDTISLQNDLYTIKHETDTETASQDKRRYKNNLTFSELFGDED